MTTETRRAPGSSRFSGWIARASIAAFALALTYALVVLSNGLALRPGCGPGRGCLVSETLKIDETD